MDATTTRRLADEEEGLIEGKSLLGHANNLSEDDFDRKPNFPACKVWLRAERKCCFVLPRDLFTWWCWVLVLFQPMIYHHVDRDVQDEKLRLIVNLCYYAWYGRWSQLVPPSQSLDADFMVNHLTAFLGALIWNCISVGAAVFSLHSNTFINTSQ